jgi:hypothetical protein
MNHEDAREWWLWQMYRCVAEFVNDPSEVSQARLQSIILEYRNYHRQESIGLTPKHDWVVDFG